MTKTKINQELKNKLFSANTAEAISAINKLKEQGNKDYLFLLFELLGNQPEEELRKEILELLGAIKDKETIPVFIEALKEEKFSSNRKEILTTCWQSGLDFSPYMEVFINLIISNEWEIAFEAFTVIENLEHFPPEEELKILKLKIASALKSSDEQKAYFLEEILKMTS